MIHISIEARTIGELRAKLNEVLSDDAAEKTQLAVCTMGNTETPDTPEPQHSAAPQDTTEEPVETMPVAEEAPPTMEEARSALNELRAKKGPKAVKEILTAHNVKSFVDLPASEYAAVIKEAKANG